MADSQQKRAQAIALLEAINDQYATYQGIPTVNPQWEWYRKFIKNNASYFPEWILPAPAQDAINIDKSRLFQAKQRAAADLGKPIHKLTDREIAPYLAAEGTPNKFEGRLIQEGIFDSAEDKAFVKKLNQFLEASDNTHIYNPFKFADNQSFIDSEGFKGLSFEDQIAFLHKLVDDTTGAYTVKAGEDLDDYHQRIGREAAEFGIEKAKEQNEKLQKALDEEIVRKLIEQSKPSSFANAKISEDDVPIKTPVYDRPDYTIHETDPELDALDEAQYYRSAEFRNKVLNSLRSKTNNTPARANTNINHIKFFI